MQDTLLRQITMLTLIPRAPRKIAIRDLESRLASAGWLVHRRSIERDLRNLSGRLALVCDEAKPAGWSWANDATPLNFGTLDPQSALALLMMARFLGPLLPRAMMATLRPQLKLAEAVLGAGALGHWTHKVAILSEVAPLQPPVLQAKILDAVSNALLESRKLEIRYRNLDGRTSAGTVSPLALVHFDGTFYVVAVYDGYDDARHLALHRLQQATMLNQRAEPPDGFDLDAYIRNERSFEQPSGCTFKLKLHVAPWLALFLEERRLGEDQTVVQQPGGTAIVTATVRESRRLVWWLLGLGGDAEVLQPAALRREIRAAAQRTARTHTPRRKA